MSVHRTASKTWRVRYWEGERQRSRNFPTRAAAERFDAEIKKRKLEGRPIGRAEDAPTIEEFVMRWFATRSDLSEKTIRGYAEALELHVIPYLGNRRVHPSELRPAIIAEWQRLRLEAGAGPSNLRTAHLVLRQVLDSAVLPYELLDSNPVIPVKAPKPERKSPRYLTAVEVERLRKEFGANYFGSATLVSVLAYVGIRPQEALALEWKHVDESLTVWQKNVDGQIVEGSKTGLKKRRRVNLPGPVADDLSTLHQLLGRPAEGLVFPRRRDGRPWRNYDYANWRRSFQRAARQAGLGSLSPYDLRHTCASLLAAAGWNHLEIARQLGHSAETSVRVYQHLLEIGDGERRSIDVWITEAREQVRAEALATG